MRARSSLAVQTFELAVGADIVRHVAVGGMALALLTACFSVVPLVRDWASTKRDSAAKAALTEAAARKAQAQADIVQARATLIAHLVEAVVNGRSIPPLADDVKRLVFGDLPPPPGTTGGDAAG